jgi:radical SAM protein with 4Fe4S-binding SPASM domain
MNATSNPNRVSWIEEISVRPLCDVPWMGNSMVLSDGRVYFCCFSNAVIGNVNQAPFDEIWNGDRMQAIRYALTQQKLPKECHSMSCPIYRGDQIEGPHSRAKGRADDPHAALRERLQGSWVWTKPHVAKSSDNIEIGVDFQYDGSQLIADLFLAIRQPDGLYAFMPNQEEYAVPFMIGLELLERDMLQPRLLVL